MRALLIALFASLAIAAPAQARCAPGQDDTVLARTAAGTIAFQTPRDAIFACRRGGEPMRIGTEPFFGAHEVRVAGGFAAISTTHCDKYDGGCFDTTVKVFNLRRQKLSARRDFSSGSGDDLYGDVLDMELCADGTLATLLRVGGNLELWMAVRRSWERLEAESGRNGFLTRERQSVWAVRDGARSSVGYGVCGRAPASRP